MDRQTAERIITEYTKPIFGFALKRCKSVHDAEDLSQEIVLRAFRALLIKDNIGDSGKFIWTVAHNTLCNYYREHAKQIVGVSVDELSEVLSAPSDDTDDDTEQAIARMQSEIAYLSKLQRRIVIAYYFENRKQADIASELHIPLGTVKWHLFEAKKELKRGMQTVRKASELKFNPVRFDSIGINGSVGKKSLDEFFRSTLAQNICYCVRNTAKTVNEIADDLGVSPVYVEAEAAFLEEYAFLQAEKDKYIVNFLIAEPTRDLLIMQDKMYKQAASLFANDLYDELVSSDILDDPDLWCGQTDEPISLTASPRADHNFLLWSLIPFVAAWSGEELVDDRISFEEVATLRPDGGHNIACATVIPEKLDLPDDYVYMRNWNGPMWNGNDRHMLWQVDTEWSDRPYKKDRGYAEESERVITLYYWEQYGSVRAEDYAWLAERGYIKTNGDHDGHFKSSWQIVNLSNQDIKARLLAIGDKIKAKHHDAFCALKEPYVQAVLRSVPPHLQKVKEYELQFLFHSDGWFLCHCLHALLQNGKLKKPTEGQRKALTTVLSVR